MRKRVLVGCGGFDYDKTLKGLLIEQPKRPDPPFGLHDGAIKETSHGLRASAWPHLKAPAGGHR